MKSIGIFLFSYSNVRIKYSTTTQGCQNGKFTWWHVWRGRQRKRCSELCTVSDEKDFLKVVEFSNDDY